MAHIGFTGIRTRKEILALEKHYQALYPGIDPLHKKKHPKSVSPSHDLLLACDVSSMPARSGRSMTLEEVPTNIEFDNNDYDVQLALHYSSSEPHTLLLQLAGLNYLFRSQFYLVDVPWPEFGTSAHPFLHDPPEKLILRVGPIALDAVEWDPARLVAKLRGCKPFITDVLLQTSEVPGEHIDVDCVSEFLAAIRRSLPFDTGVVSELDSESLQHLIPLLKEFRDLSIVSSFTDLDTARSQLISTFRLIDELRN